MLRKLESRNSNTTIGDSNNGQLLRDIEEINKALYLNKTPSSNDVRSKSVGRVRLSESKSSLNPRLLREDSSYKDKKTSSIWNWKKPLKALTHIGNKKFHCCFYLHVHSIEGLPPNFENLSLCVHWKRKNEVVQTSLSRVSQGAAEFDETLMHQCSVYGSCGGGNHPVKYESKLFLLYVSLMEAPGLDIGKQWVDLTSFLPRTLEELEGEKSSGKWTTSFNLSGKAKGANLNVSFGFWVMRDKLDNLSGNSNFPKLLNTVHTRPTMDNGAGSSPSDYSRMLRRVGTIQGTVNYGSEFLCESFDVNVCREVLLRTGLELSKSINCLYQKLDEGSLCISAEADYQQLEQDKPKLDLDFVSAEEMEGFDWDITEFSVTEVGTEIAELENLETNQIAGHTFNGPAIETINVDEILNDCDLNFDKETISISKDDNYTNCRDEVVVDDRKDERNSNYTRELNAKELKSAGNSRLISEAADLDRPIDSREFIEQQNHTEVRANYKASRSFKKSLSLDDVAESVASDFLNMLEVDHGSLVTSSNGDPESPRELLLRQFEEEALASGSFVFDFDAKHEELEFGCKTETGFKCRDHSGDSELSLIVEDDEEEHKRVSELLKRRKAQLLEGLETEALMREWGLNEKDFQNSPRTYSGGFGSPIELPPQERHQLPPLEEGFGPCVQLNNGGFLWSMSPSLSRNAKNEGSLIIQVSNPAVLPAKMGYDVMEILQNLALVGADKLYLQLNELILLEDITGKTIKEVACGAASSSTKPQRKVLLQHDSNGEKKEVHGFQPGWDYKDYRTGFISDEIPLEFASLEDLTPLVVNKIEAFFLEGLKIQSRMSNEEPPSCIYSQFIEKTSASGDKSNLIGLSITLDDWLRLDAGNFGDEEHNIEHIEKVLDAHHAKCTDLARGKLKQDVCFCEAARRKCGLLGNNLTIAHLVQLRNPFRNYEPVGVPMLLLIQVQRVFDCLMQKGNPSAVSKCSEDEENDQPPVEEVSSEKKEEAVKQDEESPQFQIIGVHLSGVNTVPPNKLVWGTTTQQQSGSRWLLSTGLGRYVGYTSKSKAIVKSSPLGILKVQPGHILWSISSNVHELGSNWADLVAPHTRNPDVIF